MHTEVLHSTPVVGALPRPGINSEEARQHPCPKEDSISWYVTIPVIHTSGGPVSSAFRCPSIIINSSCAQGWLSLDNTLNGHPGYNIQVNMNFNQSSRCYKNKVR